jgi:hypothetical protein
MSETAMKVAVVMLVGGPNSMPICDQVGASLWNLPLERDLDVSGAWSHMLAKAGFDPVYLDLLVSVSTSDVPRRRLTDFHWDLQVETRAHRGTAGTIADWFSVRKFDQGDVDWILLIEGSASPAVDLSPLCRAVQNESEFDVILGASELDRHCGCMLLRRRVFDLVPVLGFFDLKEQLLPVIRDSGGRIGAEVIAERALRISDQTSWLQALAAWRASATRSGSEVEATRSMPNESLIMPGARIDGAEIIQSIILSGAVIEPGAVVARSVVASGVRVSAGTVVSDVVLGIDRKSRVRKNRHAVDREEMQR